MNIQLWANFICSLFYIVKIPASTNAAAPRISFQTSRSLLSFPSFLFFSSWEALIYESARSPSLSRSLSRFQYGQSALLFAQESPAAIYAFM